MNEGIQALFYQDFYEAKKPVSSENELPSPFYHIYFFSSFISLKKSSMSFSKERTPRIEDPIVDVNRCFKYQLLCKKHPENMIA